MLSEKHTMHRMMIDITSTILLITLIPFTIMMKTTIDKVAMSVSHSTPKGPKG